MAIDQFLGASVGQFEMAIFFTTSYFAKGVEKVSGPVRGISVVLIEGNTIVDLMIEKKFGADVQVPLPIYENSLDTAINKD